MTRFHFERPDGFPSSDVQNISRHLNPFIPPQGFPGVAVPPPTGANMLYEDSNIMGYEDGNLMEYES